MWYNNYKISINIMQKTQQLARFFFKNNSKIIPAVLDETTLNYVLKFDGCSKGNPGPAGAGAVLYYNDVEVWSGKKFVGVKETNNCAEYCGLILGLQEAVKRNIRGLKVCGDSQLVIKQMKGEYKLKSEKLYPLYSEAKKMESTFDKIVYEHIYRQYNSRADELSNDALEDQEFYDEVKSGFK
jgi:ribonuclease HI